MNDPLRVCRREHVEQVSHQDRDLFRVEPATAPLPARFERLSLEKFHHEEDRSVLVDVVVQHPDRAAVLHGVRDVPLTNETSTERGVDRELGVKNLHGNAIPVPVGGRIHDGHAADAEDAIELVLSLERRTDAEARSR